MISRRNFFKLAGTSLLAGLVNWKEKKDMATNGQLLERFLNGETLLPSEKQQLVQAVADWDAARYILDGVMNGQQGLERPAVFDPNWRTSPLHLFACNITASIPTVNNTWKTITFDVGGGDVSVFDFWQNNKSKIRVDRAQINLTLDGHINWADNTAFDRVTRVRYFDSADVLIATQELSKMPATNSAGFGALYPFVFSGEIKKSLPNVSYLQLEALQNSGGALDIIGAYLSLRVA